MIKDIVVCNDDEIFLNCANPGLFFIYFCLLKHTSQILQQIGLQKMSIQYTVLGFELTTFGHESPLITTRPGLPPFDEYF